MLKVPRGRAYEATEALRGMAGIKAVHRVLGEYPLFLIVQADCALLLHRLIDEAKRRSGATDVWHVLISYEGCNEGPAGRSQLAPSCSG